jgi:hypothetical protein
VSLTGSRRGAVACRTGDADLATRHGQGLTGLA